MSALVGDVLANGDETSVGLLILTGGTNVSIGFDFERAHVLPWLET